MSKFDRKFLERISEIMYEDTKIVRIRNPFRHVYSFVHFRKHDLPIKKLVDETAWQVILHIKDDKTHITVQPIILTERGWAEYDDPIEDTVVGKDHLLFKPLIGHIEKIKAKEDQKDLDKIEEVFIKKQTCETDPISLIYKEMLEDAEDKMGRKVTALGQGNPGLIDFTKPPAEDE